MIALNLNSCHLIPALYTHWKTPRMALLSTSLRFMDYIGNLLSRSFPSPILNDRIFVNGSPPRRLHPTL